MTRFVPLFIFCALFVSCSGGQNNENKSTDPQSSFTFLRPDSVVKTKVTVSNLHERYIIDTLEQRIIDAGLVDIQTLIPGILIDVRYSDTNNFMGMDVYGHLNRIYLQPTVAEDLLKVQHELKRIDSSLTLLVYDGVRPRQVQQLMWDALDMPIHEKTKFVSNPKNGSIHNYGAAVDLTIADTNGIALDMGAGYDDIRKIAYPRHEKAYLDSGMLTSEHIANRQLLRDVMRTGGFWNIQTEWWHFNRYNREKAKSLYQIIE